MLYFYPMRTVCKFVKSLILLARPRRLHCYRSWSLYRLMFVAVTLTAFYLLFISLFLRQPMMQYSVTLPKPFLHVPCLTHNLTTSHLNTSQRSWPGKLRADAKILLFTDMHTSFWRSIAEVLEANRLQFQSTFWGNFPSLLRNEQGRYSLIVFENFNGYLRLNERNRWLLDNYCRHYGVGVIGFVTDSGNDHSSTTRQLGNLPVYRHLGATVQNYYLSASSSVLRIAQPGRFLVGDLPGKIWVPLIPVHKGYETVAFVEVIASDNVEEEADDEENVVVTDRLTRQSVVDATSSNKLFQSVALLDAGQFDGVRRVLFGSDLSMWTQLILFMDSIHFLSNGRLLTLLDRYVLIDIDDIFVGKIGTRLVPDDVKALIDAQERWGRIVSGFKFNLGFSGKFYKRGTATEQEGDDYLLANRHRFWWFGHMWNHMQSHKLSNVTQLIDLMKENQQFSQGAPCDDIPTQFHGIPLTNHYAIAPHHSGVYPVHEPLYEAWRQVWDVRVTATEEYPHFKPPRFRRGFVYRGIMVLPRQTCGIYTHTIFLDKYPRGKARLQTSILGGELFRTLLFNPVNVFMTHMTNYGGDRLGLYTFDSALRFLHCWTRLRLATLPPSDLGQLYFRLFPGEVEPLWRNPCADRRHAALWPMTRGCPRLPSAVVIGPQKSGTTALYTFLNLHPNVTASTPSRSTFEEVQFFNGPNYLRGLDWYLDFFPVDNLTLSLGNATANPDRNGTFVFEKSATYFDSEHAPRRMAALLPTAKLVTVLIDPGRRAYSWYQHMRAHNDPAAMNYTFDQVVNTSFAASDNDSRALHHLRQRCLEPGLYARHLARWLRIYPSKQVMIIDGDEVRSDPITVMHRIQEFFQLQPVIDFSTRIEYNAHKGFFCTITQSGHRRCLGRSKGRHYAAMDSVAESLLRDYYASHNAALRQLLKRFGYPSPSWL